MDNISFIVEIVGPAGAGKTTIISELSQSSSNIQPLYRLRHFKNLPFFANSAVSLLPMFVSQLFDNKQISIRDLVRMTRIKATPGILRQVNSIDFKIVLLDQGPIYTLATLSNHLDGARSGDFTDWWQQMLSEVSSVVDLVIWLEAPDEVLATRIRERSKWHSVKEKSDQEISEYLANFRKRYSAVLSNLAAYGASEVLCFDTYLSSLEEITDHTMNILNSRVPGANIAGLMPG